MRSVVHAFILLTSLFFIGCRTEKIDDLAPPLVEILSITPSQASDSVCGTISDIVVPVAVNDSITIKLRLSDDVALSEAKFDIHHNFDCHGHQRIQSGSKVWNEVRIVSLEGSSMELTATFRPPDEVITGNYHFGIMVSDQQGRLAEYRFFDVKVIDPVDTQSPSITLESPVSGTMYLLSDSLWFSGTLTDDTSVALGEIEITLTTPGGIEFAVARIDVPETAGNSFAFSLNYGLPPFFQAGTYTLKIQGKDWRNNETQLIRSIELGN